MKLGSKLQKSADWYYNDINSFKKESFHTRRVVRPQNSIIGRQARSDMMDKVTIPIEVELSHRRGRQLSVLIISVLIRREGIN